VEFGTWPDDPAGAAAYTRGFSSNSKKIALLEMTPSQRAIKENKAIKLQKR